MQREITLGGGAEPEEIPLLISACTASHVEFQLRRDGAFTELDVSLAGEDARYDRLLLELQQRGQLYVRWRESRKYTKDEVRRASLLAIRPTTQVDIPDDNFSQENYKMQGACRYCGSGAQRVRSLRFDFALIGKKDITATFCNNILISERLRTMILDAKLGGFVWRKCVHAGSKDDKMDPVFEVLSSSTLPRISQKTKTKWNAECPGCRNSGLLPMSEIYYSKDELSAHDASDFNRTFEYMEAGEGSHVAAIQPWYIVSQAFLQLMRQHNVRHFRVEPVHLV